MFQVSYILPSYEPSNLHTNKIPDFQLYFIYLLPCIQRVVFREGEEYCIFHLLCLIISVCSYDANDDDDEEFFFGCYPF